MEDVKVKPHDVVTVVATKLAQYMIAGKEYVLHTVAAGKLIERGIVTLK